MNDLASYYVFLSLLFFLDFIADIVFQSNFSICNKNK